MPTYEYRCRECQHELEAQQSFSDPALTECPTCGGTLKKKFSSVGISFKGSGFYKTDSRSSTGSSKKSEPVTKESPSSESSGSASTTSESKSSDGGTKSTDGGSKKAAAASA
jgi:putative FmdB family regulatory protein